jgi:hypothetical protein
LPYIIETEPDRVLVGWQGERLDLGHRGFADGIKEMPPADPQERRPITLLREGGDEEARFIENCEMIHTLSQKRSFCAIFTQPQPDMQAQHCIGVILYYVMAYASMHRIEWLFLAKLS